MRTLLLGQARDRTHDEDKRLIGCQEFRRQVFLFFIGHRDLRLFTPMQDLSIRGARKVCSINLGTSE
jgi:hypothetical protein